MKKLPGLSGLLLSDRQWPPASSRNMLPPVPVELQKSIRAVRPGDGSKVIALTFDLCEGPGEIAGYDAEIINFLRTAQIKATFFAGGKWLQSHPDRAMQLMADPLFEIGNHSWNHPNFRLLAEPQMLAQILRTQAQYELLWQKLADKVQVRGLPVSEMAKIPPVPLIFRFPLRHLQSRGLARHQSTGPACHPMECRHCRFLETSDR